MNGQGIWKWEADVAGNSIDFAYDFAVNFSSNDGLGSTIVQTLAVSGTKTWNRVGVFATPAAQEFNIYAGRDKIGDPLSDTPPFFRKVNPQFPIPETPGSSILFSWSESASLHIVTDTTDDTYTGTVDYSLSVRLRDDGTMEWALVAVPSSDITDHWYDAIGDLSHDETFAVDEITLKKAGSIDWGFSYDDSPANPGSFPTGAFTVTAWNVHHRITATVS